MIFKLQKYTVKDMMSFLIQDLRTSYVFTSLRKAYGIAESFGHAARTLTALACAKRLRSEVIAKPYFSSRVRKSYDYRRHIFMYKIQTWNL